MKSKILSTGLLTVFSFSLYGAEFDALVRQQKFDALMQHTQKQVATAADRAASTKPHADRRFNAFKKNNEDHPGLSEARLALNKKVVSTTKAGLAEVEAAHAQELPELTREINNEIAKTREKLQELNTLKEQLKGPDSALDPALKEDMVERVDALEKLYRQRSELVMEHLQTQADLPVILAADSATQNIQDLAIPGVDLDLGTARAQITLRLQDLLPGRSFEFGPRKREDAKNGAERKALEQEIKAQETVIAQENALAKGKEKVPGQRIGLDDQPSLSPGGATQLSLPGATVGGALLSGGALAKTDGAASASVARDANITPRTEIPETPETPKLTAAGTGTTVTLEIAHVTDSIRDAADGNLDVLTVADAADQLAASPAPSRAQIVNFQQLVDKMQPRSFFQDHWQTLIPLTVAGVAGLGAVGAILFAVLWPHDSKHRPRDMARFIPRLIGAGVDLEKITFKQLLAAYDKMIAAGYTISAITDAQLVAITGFPLQGSQGPLVSVKTDHPVPVILSLSKDRGTKERKKYDI